MQDTVISFNNVSKKFKKGQRYYLKQALLDFFRPGVNDDFWALRNVSFKVQKGEAIGIIGANGSGKSTILKLIAGVLTPTKGNVVVNGRIGPLIELGAGFHPELSGRDNIYLNGTILGLPKKELERKFEDIVDFAELSDFIDTPVKHYSSGMQVRLGFSIATQINPEILIIDEVLSVGDASFQNKCLSLFGEFKKRGITIIIVSHQINLIEQFCQRLILVEKGKIEAMGNPRDVIPVYFSSVSQGQVKDLINKKGNVKRFGSGEVRIEKVEILDDSNKVVTTFETGKNYKIRFRFKKNKDIDILNIGIGVYKTTGEYCFGLNTQYDHFKVTSKNSFELLLKNIPLNAGEYYYNVVCFGQLETKPYDWVGPSGRFVVSSQFLQRGLTVVNHSWVNN
ncbi:ABC transporter ATP-binding protein [Candidatus Daviesbacteria bacterium]|nr:ABC transporter ATP-binding protein [Candidatus Daviesbacteria bacterium]